MKRIFADLANRLLWKIKARLVWLEDLEAFEACFYRCYRKGFFFIQIGANDGIRADPIHKLVVRHRLQGLAVEPLADMFASLRRTYASYPEVRLANVAIHRTDAEIVLHRVRPDAKVSDWAHGIASINPHHHELSGTISEDITEERVPAIDLMSLLESYGVSRCDAFITDTEGYDHEVLNMLLDTPLRPPLIMFEHGMLQNVMTRDTYLALVNRLMGEGYFVITDHGDAIAYKT